LLGVDMHGQMKPGQVADTFFVTASGLGGDPFPTLQASLSKAHRYKLQVNWRRSRFFNRPVDTPASLGGFDTRVVTDFHSWTTERQIGNVALTYDVSNRLKMLVTYDRVANGGSIQSTRSLDYTGASSTWAGFARANAFALVGPVDTSTDRGTVGIAYSRDRWSLNYRAGYQALRDHQTFSPVATPERSINVVDAATANEPLTALRWTQSRKLSTPVSELSFVARPASSVEWRSDYSFYRYRGPFSLDAAYTGSARAPTAGTYSPYNVAAAIDGETSVPTSVLDQGLTWRPLPDWAFDASYRYSHSLGTSDATLRSVVSLYPTVTAAPASVTEEVATDWRNNNQSLGFSATWMPLKALTLRPGLRIAQRDVRMREDGVVNDGASNRERAVWPEILVGYRPSSQFSARGTYQTAYVDSPYTRMSPAERAIGRVIVHIAPTEALSIDVSASQTDAAQREASFTSHTRATAVTLSYALDQRLSLTGGFDYQSFLGTGRVTFARGTVPITNLPMHDREIDRVWQFGASVQPVKAFGLTATGNYDRTSGLDQIFGEPALYGPSALFYMTGTLYVEVPRAGRISFDVQRTTSASGASYLVYVRNVSAPHSAATSIMRVMCSTPVSLVSS
ncbi:MAG: MtrB/PioB family outer membrane beta-barrel protein, partial [Vicinamibacterales bacterium]